MSGSFGKIPRNLTVKIEISETVQHYGHQDIFPLSATTVVSTFMACITLGKLISMRIQAQVRYLEVESRK